MSPVNDNSLGLIIRLIFFIIFNDFNLKNKTQYFMHQEQEFLLFLVIAIKGIQLQFFLYRTNSTWELNKK